MAFSPVDEAALSFYFAAKGCYERSTCGPMLERARLFGYGSDGKRIERYSENWHWHPDGDHMLACHDDSGDQGYTIDTEYIDKVAPVDRRLRLVERRDPLYVLVLESYYGDSGNRWEENRKDRFDEKGNATRAGFGQGRICAIYQHTEGGQKLLRRQRMKTGEHLTPDQVLEQVYAQQAAQARPEMTVRLRKIGAEAEVLITAARISWLRTQGNPRPMRRPGPPPGKILVHRGEAG